MPRRRKRKHIRVCPSVHLEFGCLLQTMFCLSTNRYRRRTSRRKRSKFELMKTRRVVGKKVVKLKEDVRSWSHKCLTGCLRRLALLQPPATLSMYNPPTTSTRFAFLRCSSPSCRVALETLTHPRSLSLECTHLHTPTVARKRTSVKLRLALLRNVWRLVQSFSTCFIQRSEDPLPRCLDPRSDIPLSKRNQVSFEPQKQRKLRETRLEAETE